MALNLSPLLEKLRIAGPDLIVGVMGVPIAFSFQRIAEKVNDYELILSKTQLYAILGILIFCYLISALIILDLTHRFDKRSVWVRAMQVMLALIFVGSLFALANEGDSPERLNQLLNLCVFSILLMPLPKHDQDFRLANRDDVLYFLMSLVALIRVFSS